MKRFEIYADGILVGRSDLEMGDPPMGVAYGIFYPSDKYTDIQEECRKNQSDQSHLKLSIKLGDRLIECQGVAIQDSEEPGDDQIEVSALGIPFPLYEELFPGRYAEYEENLKK